MTTSRLSTNVDLRIQRSVTPGFPVTTRGRLRDSDVDRALIAARLADGRVAEPWAGLILLGDYDAGIPIEVLRRAAVATVEPNAALGGVSAIERLTGWDRFVGEIVVVCDRYHANLAEHRITFRRISCASDLEDAPELRGVPTTAAVASIIHAARDLTPLQAANALRALRYAAGLRLDDVRAELGGRSRIVGAPVLRRALHLLDTGSAGTKSRSEDVMHPLVTARYGAPLVNVRGAAGIPDYEPDFLWSRKRRILEIDGRHHLDDPVVREADRVRDALLRAHGWTVVRIPWWWVWHRRAHALRVIDAAFHRELR